MDEECAALVVYMTLSLSSPCWLRNKGTYLRNIICEAKVVNEGNSNNFKL